MRVICDSYSEFFVEIGLYDLNLVGGGREIIAF